jgi:DNA-binding NtrC family response regulator
MKENLSERYNRESQILLVEDDGEILKFLKIHLNRFFAKITAVNNSNDAMKSIKDREIDLVISDYNLPNFNGYELWQKIKRRDASISFMIITGEVLTHSEEELLRSSDGFLRKPFSVEKLHEFIKIGLTKRDLKKELWELLIDKKKLNAVLAEPKSVTQLVKVDHLPQAQQILAKLAAY